ncbi:aminotransferase, class I and II [Methanoregula boonei 6A8]|uniref:Histidinol-phosphate aminotransferase n=1 Tax=Methanoregula boonei (strain DSM 21154 / JCM 14090 / 6A8) TaxID=456442 RepID=A7IA90_METB6|nr:histidinol-phosphate transaminase [Methanoregula boonei]ABS56651.1 aminotransferase, class I and II [Methanoregula boonei 6A8]
MERLVRSCYKQGGYVFAKKAGGRTHGAGDERIARLASNENPEGPSPAAVMAAQEAVLTANRYPDERVDVLVSALKTHYGDYAFVAGVGMDGVIETLMRTLVEPGETVAVSTPTFSFYGLAAQAQGAKVVSVPRRADFSVDIDALIAAGKDAKIIVLCSPNNPTGNATRVEDVKRVLEGINGFLFLDNAYVEFSGIDYLPLIRKYENLVIGRTFSKVYSLAGLRIGYAFVPAWLQPYYARAGTPFTVNSVSAAAAAAALSDDGHADRYIGHVRVWRKRYADKIKFPVLPSDANFVMINVTPHTGDEIVENLAAKGVLVRSCRSFTGLGDHYIRVSVGEDWENERCIQELNAL